MLRSLAQKSGGYGANVKEPFEIFLDGTDHGKLHRTPNSTRVTRILGVFGPNSANTNIFKTPEQLTVVIVFFFEQFEHRTFSRLQKRANSPNSTKHVRWTLDQDSNISSQNT